GLVAHLATGGWQRSNEPSGARANRTHSADHAEVPSRAGSGVPPPTRSHLTTTRAGRRGGRAGDGLPAVRGDRLGIGCVLRTAGARGGADLPRLGRRQLRTRRV